MLICGELPLQDFTTDVWCAMSATRITQTIFSETINLHQYVTHNLMRFSEEPFVDMPLLSQTMQHTTPQTISHTFFIFCD
jgi:hypothetical protein